MFRSTLTSPATAASALAIALRNLRKVYGRGEGEVVALDGVSVRLAVGSFTAIMEGSKVLATPSSPISQPASSPAVRAA